MYVKSVRPFLFQLPRLIATCTLLAHSVLLSSFKADADRHHGITQECLEDFITAYSDRFTDCRACLQASEVENDAIWACCDPNGKNCGNLFPHLEYVTEPCDEEDKEKLKIAELQDTGNVWASTCEQVLAEPPPVPPFAATDEDATSDTSISLFAPPSPQQISDESGSGSSDDLGQDSVSCTPTAPSKNPEICLVHGDPHVMGFGYAEGGMLTCDATKEVDLLSNKFLCIRAEAQELVQSVANSSVAGASVISSITITYKNSSCGSSAAINSATEWEDERLQTRVIVKEGRLQSGQRYLTVWISTPLTAGASGWCVDGCPDHEVSSLAYDSQANPRQLKRGDMRFNRDAKEACRAQGLQGDFLRACTFDVSYSADKSFIETIARDAGDFAQALQVAGLGENSAMSAIVMEPVLSIFLLLVLIAII